MKHINFAIVLLGFGLMLASCNKGNKNVVSFGEVNYYPSFLFTSDKIEPITKTFDLEFSEDAKLDKNCYAEFQFVDNDGKPVSTSIMQVTVDDKPLKDNKFKVTSGDTEKTLTFAFTPEAKSGKYQGYLKLVSHNLDRLDAQELSMGQQVDALQWTINYNKSMNPLAKGLMWLGILLLIALALWFLIIQRMLFDYFKAGRFQIKQPYSSQHQIKRARQLVCTNKATKQGRFNKLFTGKVIYEINPVWTTPVFFEVASKGQVKMKLNNKYSIDPNDLPLKKGVEYTLTNEDTKERIILTIY